ncbi:hypothetical protein GF386_03075 [Candidatus Pacearchaeota archaeon]|nr:hypothetical protein [Candidatus Pacearchaeota archaeon]MBD3283122.1 hypothetical protein [Candidatus Pacearchaeota archaeon]
MNKKGIAIATIIAIIIAILGFVILLFFLSQLGWGRNVDREICHQSVVYRATLPEIGGAKDYVPLRCKTQKICITSGSGECQEYKGFKSVKKINVRDEDEIEKLIAQEIVGCWQMMGEGKLSLFSDWFAKSFGFKPVTSSCVICSRIAFDKESLKRSGIDSDKIDVMDYMITHKMPGKEFSYYVYLTGQSGKMSIDRKLGSVELKDPESGEENDLEIHLKEAEESEFQEISVMFMQVYSPSYGSVLKNDLTVLLGGTAGSFVLAPVFTSRILGKAALSPWTWTVLAIVGAYQMGTVAANQAVTAGYCGDISVGKDSKLGCSVVRTVNYDAEDVSKYCSVIESIP